MKTSRSKKSTRVTDMGGAHVPLLLLIVLLGNASSANSFDQRSTRSRRHMMMMMNGGPNIGPRIIGGEAAPVERYPYAVSLRTRGVRSHFCMGSLVDEGWVLTAAHCVAGTEPESDEKPLLYVGAHNRTDDSTVQIRQTSDRFLYPGWNNNIEDAYRNGSDIALLKLDTPVEGVIKMPSLNDGNDPLDLKPSVVLTIIGWPREGEERQEILQQGDVELITNSRCNDLYSETDILGDMMCAGGVTVDACKGDSGGPLIFLDAPDGNEPEGDPSFDYIVGLVSFGPTMCGTRGVPGVYTRVSCFSEWISCVTNNPSDPSGCDGTPGGSCLTVQESTGCPDEIEEPMPSIDDIINRIKDGEQAAAARGIIMVALTSNTDSLLKDLALKTISVGLATDAGSIFVDAVKNCKALHTTTGETIEGCEGGGRTAEEAAQDCTNMMEATRVAIDLLTKAIVLQEDLEMNNTNEAAATLKNISNDETMSVEERIAFLRSIKEDAVLADDIIALGIALTQAFNEGGNPEVLNTLITEVIQIVSNSNTAPD